jgi:glyoxylase-like metal-dependent hydrolase (beta-lactamase superfamily II)
VTRSAIRVARIVSAGFDENSYLLWREDCSDCVVIDPGLEPEKIVRRLEQERLAPAVLLLTHGHADHIAGNASLKRRWPGARVVIGAGDAAKLTDPALNLSAAFGMALVSPPPDATVADGQVFTAAGIDLEVRAIPGHSAGHVIYLCRDEQPMLAFVGDVIFAGSIGRTDFPDGDFDRLIDGIRQKLLSLPDDTRLLPGHGPATTVGAEKRDNPFVGQ